MIEIDISVRRQQFDLVIKEVFSSGITGIFGPSGAGKTSLLHAIAGLVNPNKGHLSVGGRRLFDANKNISVPVQNRNIGYVFQEGRLFPHMSVEKNLLYGQKKNGNNNIQFAEVVELLQLDSLLQKKPSQLSGGERQRTALGRSLLSSPDILLLDEPFSAVDVNLRSQIIPFILKIQKKVNIPILVVSHDLPDLLKLTQKLCIIDQGRCIAHGNYYDLLREEAVSGIFRSSTLVNTIDLIVLESSAESGLVILGKTRDHNQAKIKCEKSDASFLPGQSIKIVIQADDIALSMEKLNNVSIQNQLPGLVTDVFFRDGSVLCMVDVGFSLVVAITAASQKRLGIEPGKKVWCLIKSVAIGVAG